MAQNKVRLSPDSWPAKARAKFPLSKVYVGDPNTDPTDSSNQKTITAKFLDGTSSIINRQPVIMSRRGLPEVGGEVVELFVDGDYSLKVLSSGANEVLLDFAEAFESSVVTGSEVSLDSSGFSGNLSPADDTVQKMAETVDQINLSAGDKNYEQILSGVTEPVLVTHNLAKNPAVSILKR